MTMESVRPSRNILAAAMILDSTVPPLVARLELAAARSREAALELARAIRKTKSGEMLAVRPEAPESQFPDELTARYKALEPKR